MFYKLHVRLGNIRAMSKLSGPQHIKASHAGFVIQLLFFIF